MNRRAWTPADEQLLRDNLNLHVSALEILLDRTDVAITKKVCKLGLSRADHRLVRDASAVRRPREPVNVPSNVPWLLAMRAGSIFEAAQMEAA